MNKGGFGSIYGHDKSITVPTVKIAKAGVAMGRTLMSK